MTTGEADAELVVPLDGLSRASLLLAGGKAANLGEMASAGMPVPRGFCVTTRAYALVAAGSTIESLHAELAGVPAGDRARLDAIAGRARDAMLRAPVPDSIRRACASAYRILGERAPVAVRSSATAEDLPDASFAGQQDTYLNVVGEDAVQDAIRRCWASLWTDRAVAYRASHGIDHREVKLAVVVQAMVEAAVAGVLFTANPVTGKRRQAVIDASPGLGEAVVSGAVNPDHFEVDTTTGEVLVRRLGDKRLAIESVEGGGTRRVERADADTEPCLSDDEIVELVRLGKGVEAHYGAPQDLEWAFDATRTLFLLQARPITTLFPLPEGAPADDRDLRVYFDFNVAQGVFRPLTPMGIACWRFFTSGIAKRAGLAAWDPHVGAPFLVEAAGRVFIDVTAAVRNTVGRKAMGFALSRMEARSAAEILPLLEDPRLSLLPFSKARLAWVVVSALLRTRAPFVALRALRSPPSALALCARASEEALALADVEPDASPEQRLEAAERTLFHAVQRVFLVHLPTVVAGMLSFVVAKRLLAGLSTEVEHDVVFRALPHNPTTEMDLALFGLAQEIRSDDALRRFVRETPPEELSRKYRERTLPQALQGGLEQFLERYGARGVAEIDVGVARWAEDPAHLLGSLANYLALDAAAFAPDEQFEKAKREAEGMQEELCRRARAKGLVRGTLVRFFLGRMRSLAGIREAPKFQLVRILARVRTLLLGIGESLVSERRLGAPAGIFFLTFPEVHRAIGGSDLRGAVRERTAAYEREIGRKHLPRFLLSDGTEPAVQAGAATGALSGTPASAGTITGIARVVLDPNGARLEPGEILVAPSTDPGWTPLFLTAGGLVMEMGGAMSHGAVVAREYGIPAVVGVPHATERIRTGQRIRVDGATGAIDLLDESGPLPRPTVHRPSPPPDPLPRPYTK